MRTIVLAVSLLCAATLQAFPADALTFEVYEDAKMEFRWRLKNSEGQVLATPGQGYKTKKYCEESVEKFKANVDGDKVRFEVYQDNKKESRWRLIAKSNGQTVATSPSSYKTADDCNKAIALIKKEAKNAKVEVK